MLPLRYAPIARTIISLTMLGYAAYSDAKSREVDDLVWLLLCVLTAPFILLELTALDDYFLKAYVVSIYIAFTFGLSVSAFNLMGEADFLALSCIGLVTIPTRVSPLGLFPSISVLTNSLLLSCAFPLSLLFQNLKLMLKGENLFENVEAGKLTKFLALFTLKMVTREEYLSKKDFYSVAERVVNDKRYLTIKLGIDTEQQQISSPIVWASPHIPFVTVLAIGYLTHVLLGSLLEIILIALNLL